MPALAGQPLVRVSPDGGRTYPRGAKTALTAELPGGPATVPVYDEGSGTGRMLALDFDSALAAKAGAADPAAEVAGQAAAVAAVTARLGGASVTDVSPSGGRHVYILFAVPLPWRELRDLAAAMRRRYTALDTMPMASPQSGQIRPPGSPHKAGGWSILAMPLQDAVDAVRRPCGPAVWSGLLDEFAAELDAAVPAIGPGSLPPGFAAGDDGTPWRPLPGGRIPVSSAMDKIARTGTWPAGKYKGRSEAREAVLLGAAACGWRLADVRAEIAGGRWRAMDGLYARPGEPARMHRLLAAEWLSAVAHLAEDDPPPDPDPSGGKGEDPRNWHTSQSYPRPPLEAPARAENRSRQLAVINEYAEIRRWVTATDIAASDSARLKRWGRQAITIRLVLTALAQAAMVRGSRRVAFGSRNLSLYSGVSWRTVARALEELRSEPDPLIELVTSHYLKRADVYVLRIPDAYAEAASWRRRRAGWITAIHPAFSDDSLGGTAALTYAILTGTPVPSAEAARAARLGETAAADALHALAAYGLAEKTRRGWTRGPASLDDTALASGALAAHAELIDRYGKERDTWHEKIDSWLNGPEPVMPDDPEQPALAGIPLPAGPSDPGEDDDDAWSTPGEAPAAVAVRTAPRLALSARRRALRDTAGLTRAGQAPLGPAATLVTAAGGRRAVCRTVDPGTEGTADDVRYLADSEELAALAGEAIGAPVAAAWRQDPGRVWSEYLEGRPAAPGELAGSPAAALIGLLDAVTGYRDRRGHLLVTPDGTLAGFGGAGAWLPWETTDPAPGPCEPGAPAALYITPDGRWRDDPPVTRVTAAATRHRIEALRPAFRARDREQWLDWTLARLGQITRRAPAAP